LVFSFALLKYLRLLTTVWMSIKQYITQANYIYFNN